MINKSRMHTINYKNTIAIASFITVAFLAFGCTTKNSGQINSPHTANNTAVTAAEGNSSINYSLCKITASENSVKSPGNITYYITFQIPKDPGTIYVNCNLYKNGTEYTASSYYLTLNETTPSTITSNCVYGAKDIGIATFYFSIVRGPECAINVTVT